MEPIPRPTRRSSSPSRRITARERELQQLKSRGVVSVLNKTFDAPDDRAFLTRSPSPTLRQPRSSSSIRSSCLVDNDDEDRKHQRRSFTTPPPPVPRLRKVSGSDDHSVESESTDRQSVVVYQLLQQTQQSLALCQLEQQQQQKRHSNELDELCAIIRKQDRLVNVLEAASAESSQDWQELRQELDGLKVDRDEYEYQIKALRRALEISQNETRQLAILARSLLADSQSLMKHQRNQSSSSSSQPQPQPHKQQEEQQHENYQESIPLIDDAHLEFTQQLQSRLSLSDDIAHLTLWDYAALDRQQAAKRASLTPTSSTQHNTAFWKGMKKKLGV